jgi:hypothetical protein
MLNLRLITAALLTRAAAPELAAAQIPIAIGFDGYDQVQPRA